MPRGNVFHRLALSRSRLVILSLGVLCVLAPIFAADTASTSPAPAPAAAAPASTSPAGATVPAPAAPDRSSDYFSRSRYSRDSRDSRDSRSRYSRDTVGTSAATRSAEDDILLRKSIFAKDRRALYNPYDRTASDTATTRPPAIPVFDGVILEDTGYVAYIEDPDTGKLWPFADGDPLPQDYGSVREVALDYMTIVRDGATKRILVGQNLNGEIPSAYSAPSSASYASSGSSASSGPAPSTLPAATEGAMTLEERMKLRAKQQRGQ